MMDDADTIARKIRKARTDQENIPSEKEGLQGRPEAGNLVGIFAALAGESVTDVLSRFGGSKFAPFKQALSELAVEKLEPIANETRRLMDDPSEIDMLLNKGAERARDLAQPLLRETKEIIGLIQP